MVMILLPGVGIVFMIIFLAFLILPIYCIVDAISRPSSAFKDADSDKTLWIVLLFIFSPLAAVIYLAAIRPKVRRVQ